MKLLPCTQFSDAFDEDSGLFPPISAYTAFKTAHEGSHAGTAIAYVNFGVFPMFQFRKDGYLFL